MRLVIALLVTLAHAVDAQGVPQRDTVAEPAVPENLRPAVDETPELLDSAFHQSVLRYGFLNLAVRERLAQRWTDDPRQAERGACVTAWHALRTLVVTPYGKVAVDSVFVIDSLTDFHGDTTANTPSGVRFACGARVPELHTHPPATCETLSDADSCLMGGPAAWMCTPSRQDYGKMVIRRAPFAVIQCDRHAFRFYFPTDTEAQHPLTTDTRPEPPPPG